MMIVTVSFPSIRAGGYLLYSPLLLHLVQSQAPHSLQIKGNTKFHLQAASEVIWKAISLEIEELSAWKMILQASL